jgi:hypothetical protein
VELLQAKGVDVHKAVVAAREAQRGTEWLGAMAHKGSWRSHVAYDDGQQHWKQLNWHGLPSAAAAARQADCGLLAVRGMECNVTNFPASVYSQQQLQEAGEHAISKGMEAALVKKHLQAVEKVWLCRASPQRLGAGCCRIVCRQAWDGARCRNLLAA